MRVEWRSAPGDDPENLDFAEGALTAVSDQAVTLATPYAGILSIPRELAAETGRARARPPARHRPGGPSPGRRVLHDRSLARPAAAGRGSARADDRAGRGSRPPRAFSSSTSSRSSARTTTRVWSQRVRDGELRTYVVVNGKRIDYLNRYIKTRNNDAPERVAIPIPRGPAACRARTRSGWN